MATLLFRDRRRSRNLFDWSARWALERNSLDAITGQASTFARASLGTAFDSGARLAPYAYGQPRFVWVTDPLDGIAKPRLLLEDARTNVVLWSRDLTNAAWTKTNATVNKDQTGIDGLLNSASSILATAGNATVLQAITLASSARFQSAYVKRLVGTGAVQMTTDNGATWTTIALTAAYTRLSIPTQTLANPTVGFRIVTNGDKIAVDVVQNENGIFASSALATTSASVARVADALSFAWNAPPQAMTVYAKFSDLGSQALGAGVIDVGGNGATPRIILYSGVASNYTANHSGTSIANQSTAVAIGDTVELRGVLNADGSTLIGVSKNGAAEGTSSDPTAPGLETAWAVANLYFNRYSSVNVGFSAFEAVRVAAGAQSLATMREG